ncbi:hypothetical protein [Marinactinospora rubrisoli]|uniref:Uncharacterized protein n=1 Tax=Marinactinospora rubrisoli TaxID=2715399 RepID=A0ABW2KD34_9ACTN
MATEKARGSRGADDLGDEPTVVTYPASGREVVSMDFPLREFTRHAGADVDPNARRNAESSRAFRAQERNGPNQANPGRSA